MDAEGKIQWRSNLIEIKALREILPRCFLTRGVFIGHEQVAEINVEIRRIGVNVGECLLINFSAGMFIEVHIGGHGESERAARCAGGVERRFRRIRELSRTGRPPAKPIKIL